jgi:hypothetical protein
MTIRKDPASVADHGVFNPLSGVKATRDPASDPVGVRKRGGC